MSEEKSNRIEIKETLRGSYIASICTIIFGIAIMIIVTIAVFSLAEPGFQMMIGVIILVISWLLIVALLVWLGLKMRRGGKVRTFVITDNAIIFNTPNKPSFEINTSDFNTLEVSRVKKEDFPTVILHLALQPSRRTVFYKFHFLEATKVFFVESGVDYSRKGLQKIRTALEEFCLENGKNYYFKK